MGYQFCFSWRYKLLFQISYNVPICAIIKDDLCLFLREIFEMFLSFTQLLLLIKVLSTISQHGPSSSLSCRAASTDIPDPLLPLLSIIHRLWQVFRATSHILTELLYVCSSWSSCFCSAICEGPSVFSCIAS